MYAFWTCKPVAEVISLQVGAFNKHIPEPHSARLHVQGVHSYSPCRANKHRNLQKKSRKCGENVKINSRNFPLTFAPDGPGGKYECMLFGRVSLWLK